MQELRTTTGQRVTISYDPKSNALTFTELLQAAARAVGRRHVFQVPVPLPAATTRSFCSTPPPESSSRRRAAT